MNSRQAERVMAWLRLAAAAKAAVDKPDADRTLEDWRAIALLLAVPRPKRGRGRPPNTKEAELLGPLRRPGGAQGLFPREMRQRIADAVHYLKFKSAEDGTDKPLSDTRACYQLLKDAGVFDLVEFEEEAARAKEARRLTRRLRDWRDLPETLE